MEKTRDIGVLMALGAPAASIQKIFFLQGAMIGILGTSVGVVLGLGLGTALEAVVPGAGALGRGLFALLLGYLGATVTLAKRDELEEILPQLPPVGVIETFVEPFAGSAAVSSSTASLARSRLLGPSVSAQPNRRRT